MYLITLSIIFTTLLLTANITAVKIIAVGSNGIDTGIIAYPLTFLISDVLSEVYGRKTTTKIIWIGFFANLLMITMLFIAGQLPSASFWNEQDSYNKISFKPIFDGLEKALVGSRALGEDSGVIQHTQNQITFCWHPN